MASVMAVVMCLLPPLAALSSSVAELYVLEELPAGSYVGNLANVAEVYRKYSPEVAATLRFRILFQSVPSTASRAGSGRDVAERPLFSVNEENSDIKTVRRIDREEFCGRAGTCAARLDVIVQPAAFFEILRARIHVLDVNDNSPVFPVRVLEYALPELQITDVASTSSGGFLIAEADDPDGPVFGVQRYVIIAMRTETTVMNEWNTTTTSIPFELNHERGQLRVLPTRTLDRETMSRHKFRVVALDGGEPSLSGSVDIVVTITDINYNSPTFARASVEARVREDSTVGTVVCRVTASDADVGLNAALRYRFTAETNRQHGSTFDVGPDTGAVVVVGALDYETRRDYALYVTATDRAGAVHDDGALTGMISIVVRVEDVNDHSPDIAFNFRQRTADGDHHQEANLRRRHELENQGIAVVALDHTTHVGSFVGHVTVRDADDGENSRFRCVLLSSSGSKRKTDAVGNRFALRQMYDTEYTIVTTAPFVNLTRSTSVQLNVYCADGGRPTLTSEASFVVIIGEVTDDDPDILSDRSSSSVLSIAVAQDVPVGTAIYCPRTSNDDRSSAMKSNYRITDVQSTSHRESSTKQFFEVDTTTGVVRTKLALSRKLRCRLEVHLWKEDVDQSSKHQSFVRLSIVIVDVSRRRHLQDDEVIMVELAEIEYEFSVIEGSRPGTYVGAVSAGDLCLPASSDKVYKFVGKDSSTLSKLFHVGLGDGRLTTAAPLDRERRSHYTLLLSALLSTDVAYVDAAGCQHLSPQRTANVEAVARIHVTVTDINDNAPFFEFPRPGNDIVTVARRAGPGHVVSRVIAHDRDLGNNASISYRIETFSASTQVFSIDSKTGEIYLIVNIGRISFESSPFSLQVSATDGGRPPLSTLAVLRVAVAGNETAWRPDVGARSMLRSMLASDRLAAVLTVLLVCVFVVIAVVLLSTLFIDRQRCRFSDKLTVCDCWPARGISRKTDIGAVDVLPMPRCCCFKESQREQKATALSHNYGRAMTGDVSATTATTVTAAVRQSCGLLLRPVIEMMRRAKRAKSDDNRDASVTSDYGSGCDVTCDSARSRRIDHDHCTPNDLTSLEAADNRPANHQSTVVGHSQHQQLHGDNPVVEDTPVSQHLLCYPSPTTRLAQHSYSPATNYTHGVTMCPDKRLTTVDMDTVETTPDVETKLAPLITCRIVHLPSTSWYSRLPADRAANNRKPVTSPLNDSSCSAGIVDGGALTSMSNSSCCYNRLLTVQSTPPLHRHVDANGNI